MDEQIPGAPTRKPPLTGGEWVLLVVAAFVVSGAVGYWVIRRSNQVAPPAQAPAATASAVNAPAAPPPAPTGPAPAASRDQLRALLAPASSDPVFQRWLDRGDLLDRWVVVTDNLAEGVSPRRQLEFLAPSRPFDAAASGDRLVIAAGSYARFDGFAATVATVDARAIAAAYRALHPVLEAAYRALGYPGASLDRVTARALHRIADAPVVDGPVAVVRTAPGGPFLLGDPRLERLTAVEKQLLRMGPRNTRLLQAKARELLRALGVDGATGR